MLSQRHRLKLENSLICVFHSGTAVSLGEELVSRPFLPDPALCAERTVYSSWRHLGGDGDDLTLFSYSTQKC